MDKYQVTNRMKLLKKMINDPNTDLFDLPKELYEEINNPATDENGYVKKHQLSEEVKRLIEIIEKEKQ